MTISNVSISNQHLQQATVGAIKTDQKTVHKEDIKELKNEIKSVSQNVKGLDKISSSLLNGKFNLFERIYHMENANNNVQKNANAIVRLNKKIRHLKENINSSSYKHHSSKIKTLKALTNQVENIRGILAQANNNFLRKEKNDAYEFKINSPQYQASLAENKARLKEAQSEFNKATPGYHHGAYK
ncbi:hypothetical protein KYI78_14375 [Providencia rettgeri]|uniref:hypothetical protein n=1 Tax=Providencia rettgeri TaxID=587 RepID=UPI001C588684|nr:hypothetical protein [Providencia rettgeri]MBW3106410.1 hypothetical protein [Providencia rettgeri]